VSRRLLALLAACLLVAAAAGCGGSPAEDVAPYLGAWQRLEGGAPDPLSTLTIARRDDAVSATFADQTRGASVTVPATAEDGYLACTLPAGDTGLPVLDGSPAQSDLQLSLDENGQLVVDLVLEDGTLEPVLIYDRAAAPSPAEL